MAKRAIAAAAIALLACTKKPPPIVENDGGGASPSASTTLEAGAKSKRPSTTSWSIAGENLDGQIEGALARDFSKPKDARELVEILLARGQFVARIGDYDRAQDIAERVAKENPKSIDALRARASTYATFHRWDDALKDLDEAEKLGAPADKLASARGSIWMGLGRYDEAAKYIKDDAWDASEIAMAAVLAGLRQKHSDALRLFDKARATFRDVSPFPLAWMAFERARWLEAQGKSEEARQWYEEALDAIPIYAHAATHLAPSDPAEKAIARLEPIAKTSDDPDVLAALADAHQRAKHDDETKKLTEKARARYEELLKRHPEAFADHAARFHLKQGDAKRALELAQANAKNRSTEEALDLLLGAATAANDKTAMCDAATKMNALAWVSPERKRLAAATLTACSAK